MGKWAHHYSLHKAETQLPVAFGTFYILAYRP